MSDIFIDRRGAWRRNPNGVGGYTAPSSSQGNRVPKPWALKCNPAVVAANLHTTGERGRVKPMLTRFVLVLILFPSCLAFATSPQSRQDTGANRGTPSAAVVRATSAIIIDGVLNESDWSAAAPMGDIIQREPKQG